MTTNFNLTSGKNRALVCYCTIDQNIFALELAIRDVFEAQGVALDSYSHMSYFPFETPQPALNIALQYGETSKRLKVGGNFSDVCVGVFFYDAPQPIDTRGTMAEVNEIFGEDIEPEPPSITSLVCDTLRENFGGVYGASAFVIPQTVTSYTLEVE